MSTGESQAWQVEEILSPGEWAEKYHSIPPKGAAEPGPYSLSRTPYVRGILEAWHADTTLELLIMKSAQIGLTEALRVLMAYCIDNSTDSLLLVLPDQQTANEHLATRIIPMLKSPRLRRWLTGKQDDLTKSIIKLLHTTVFVGWSGSPQSLASRAIRYAFLDEIDKFQTSAIEADTIDLVRDRLITYRNRAKLIALSTPTTRSHGIAREFQNTVDKRHFEVPCPHCETSQSLVWEQVRFDKMKEKDENKMLEIAERLLNGSYSAHYVCCHCEGIITERDRLKIIREGHWVSSQGEIEHLRSSRIAFHISALCSSWVSLNRISAEYLRGKATGSLANFYNSFLGLPHEEVANKPDPELLSLRAKDHRAFEVPEWARLITAGADTQVKAGVPYWVYVVRAWGPNYQSRLLTWGKAYSAQDLYDQTIFKKFKKLNGGELPCHVVCIDSGGGVDIGDGSTTDLVYQMAKRNPMQVVPIKGASRKQDRLIRTSNIEYCRPGSKKTGTVLLHLLDTGSIKDIISRLIKSTNPVLWEESSAADETYVKQMTREEKARIKVNRKFILRWINPTKGRVDIFDASVYCYAAARICRLSELTEQKKVEQPQPKQQQQQRSRPQRKKFGGNDGFISRR